MPLLRKSSNPAKTLLRISALFLVALFCLAIPSFAQQEQIDALAAKTASAIAKSLRKSSGSRLVIVVFSEPSTGPTGLGAKLADEFTSALTAHGISLMSSATFQATVQREKVSPSALTNRETAGCIASDAGAEVVVDGILRPTGNKIELAVSAIRARDAKEIFKTKIDFDHSPEIDKLESEKLPSGPTPVDAKKPTEGTAEGGAKGYTLPKCLYCPTPKYADRAFRMREKGTIVLDLILGTDGRAHSVTVLRGLSCGLDQQALDAVENVWRFKPANGPDGKPAPVHMLIEVDFNIY
ncbi:MAG: energy transducer TonB [Candidatus Acidiferrales bacterium]